MRQHLKILGVLYLIMGGLYLLGAVVVAAMMAGTGFLTHDVGDAAFLSGLGAVIAMVLGVMALPGLVVGYGLLKEAAWSRIPALILGFLNLLNFPLGTLLGGYTLWALFQPETKRLLEARHPEWEP
jgi:hypothetical protein